MKIFSAAGQPGKSKRSSALNCLIVNQFATPGLGSLMGGRIVAGTIQLLMALVGFLMFVYGFTNYIYRTIDELPPPTGIMAWMKSAGILVFAVSWFLAWITSLSLLRQAPPGNRPAPFRPSSSRPNCNSV